MDVEEKLKFPFFQNYHEILNKDLTIKTAKPERSLLKLSLTDCQQIREYSWILFQILSQSDARSLEEYIIEYGTNNSNFQELIQSILTKQNSQNLLSIWEFYLNNLVILRELWIECNVLRKVAVFIRQNFADEVGKADLCKKNKASSFAKNVRSLNNKFKWLNWGNSIDYAGSSRNSKRTWRDNSYSSVLSYLICGEREK